MEDEQARRVQEKREEEQDVVRWIAAKRNKEADVESARERYLDNGSLYLGKLIRLTNKFHQGIDALVTHPTSPSPPCSNNQRSRQSQEKSMCRRLDNGQYFRLGTAGGDYMELP